MADTLEKKNPVKGSAKVIPQKLKLLFTVVDRNKAEFYTDFLQAFDANLQLSLLASGTAREEMLRYLGLGNTEKAVLLSVIREDRTDEILSALENKFKTLRGGKGIAFTVPLSSALGVSVYQFLSNNKSLLREEL